MLDNSGGTINELSLTYKCRYCEKSFRKESSLAVHLCEPKRRWRERDERAVRDERGVQRGEAAGVEASVVGEVGLDELVTARKRGGEVRDGHACLRRGEHGERGSKVAVHEHEA